MAHRRNPRRGLCTHATEVLVRRNLTTWHAAIHCTWVVRDPDVAEVPKPWFRTPGEPGASRRPVRAVRPWSRPARTARRRTGRLAADLHMPAASSHWSVKVGRSAGSGVLRLSRCQLELVGHSAELGKRTGPSGQACGSGASTRAITGVHVVHDET